MVAHAISNPMDYVHVRVWEHILGDPQGVQLRNAATATHQAENKEGFSIDFSVVFSIFVFAIS